MLFQGTDHKDISEDTLFSFIFVNHFLTMPCVYFEQHLRLTFARSTDAYLKGMQLFKASI